MKCRLIREAKRENPLWRADADAVARSTGQVYSVPRFENAPAGTVISDPEAYKLVRMGMAEPADEECAARCGMSAEQIASAVLAQEKVSKGIAPDDYHRYDRGEMVGYNPDGTDIKGPNWALYNEPTADDLFEGDEDDDGDDE